MSSLHMNSIRSQGPLKCECMWCKRCCGVATCALQSFCAFSLAGKGGFIVPIVRENDVKNAIAPNVVFLFWFCGCTDKPKSQLLPSHARFTWHITTNWWFFVDICQVLCAWNQFGHVFVSSCFGNLSHFRGLPCQCQNFAKYKWIQNIFSPVRSSSSHLLYFHKFVMDWNGLIPLCLHSNLCILHTCSFKHVKQAVSSMFWWLQKQRWHTKALSQIQRWRQGCTWCFLCKVGSWLCIQFRISK